MKVRKLPGLQFDADEFFAATRYLDERQAAAYLRLRAYIWDNGKLPIGQHDLATIANVHPRAFARMATLLADTFDIDDEGRWHDHELEAARANALEVREKRAAAGAAGARKRWEGDGETAENGMAKDMASAIPSATGNGAETGAPAVANGVARLVAHGSIDRSISEENLDQSIDQSRAQGAGEPTGKPAAPATPDGKPAGSPEGSGAMPDATSNPAIASDADIIIALRAHCGTKIPNFLLNTRDIAPLRVMLELGCDLNRDVIPAVVGFANGLRDPLRTFGAPHIREKAMASRDQARIAEVKSSGVKMIFVEEDSPQWRAWLDHRKVRSFNVVTSAENGHRRGWFFPTEWPPGIDPTAYLTLAKIAATG